MSICHWILLAGFGVFFSSALFHFFRVIRHANTEDLSQAKGSILRGVVYSLTGAMSPLNKETAYLHLPTYTAGIFYHLGSFLSFVWLLIHLSRLTFPTIISRISFYLLIAASLCGLTILVKRMVSGKLRHLSTPDDYFSNVLVTGFQMLSAIALVRSSFISYSFLYAGILFLYIPVGKLRHVIYFTLSRFYLGLFYGKRGVWPPKRQKSWQTKRP